MTDQAQQAAPVPVTGQSQHDSGTMRKYLDRAMTVLDRFGISSEDETPSELVNLLEGVKHIDEGKVLAIAEVIKHMSTFNQLVRDNVENIKVGNRYMDISQLFDSVREDSKMLISQLDDGKIRAAKSSELVDENPPRHALRSIQKNRRSLRGSRQRHQGGVVERRRDHGRLHRLPLRVEGSRSAGPRNARHARCRFSKPPSKRSADAQTQLDDYTGTDQGGRVTPGTASR